MIHPQSKLLWHLDRIRLWEETGSTSPLLFEIDPSNKCNHDCPWCSFSRLRSESKDVMCFKTVKDILNDMTNLGVKAITWTGGGEPLMNPEIVDMILYAKYKGLEQGMFTNGMLLKSKIRASVVRNLDWLRFSIDGYNHKSYAENHGTTEAAFDVTLENIREACKIENRCIIGFGYIITESNYQGIDKVTQIAKECGVDYIQFKPVVYRPHEKQISIETVEMFYHKVLEQEKHETEDFKVITTDYRFEDMMHESRGRGYNKCLSHCFQGAIGADSKVYFCDHHKGEKEYELGDLKKNTLKEIWQGGQRKKVIDYVNNTDLSQCMDCCRNHEANKLLWHIQNKGLHANHI
jgi:sulfatase maturation enzyme AslB (radical SAM superfamily)